MRIMIDPEKKILFILFTLTLPLISFGQIQIGDDIDGLLAGDNFGTCTSISADGTIIAATAYGSSNPDSRLQVFKNIGGVWELYGTDSEGGNFGGVVSYSVSLSADGHILAVGNFGPLKIFSYNINTGIWTQRGSDIPNTTSTANFGYSVKLSADGNIVAIGSPDLPIVPNQGTTQVFMYDGNDWVQVGSNINGVTANEHSGRSIDLSSNGKILAILNDNSVRVYENISSTWTLLGSEIPTIGNQSANKAISLSADGTLLAIGEPDFSDSLIQRGRVRVFNYTGVNWSQIGSGILGEVAYYRTGSSVSLSGNGQILAIGEIGSTSGSTDKGRTRVFENQGGTWIQLGTSIFGESNEDYSGGNISLSADTTTLGINSPNNDGNGIDSGHIRVYNLNPILSNNDLLLENIRLFPNPTSNYFKFTNSFNQAITRIDLIDISGKLIKKFKASEKYNIENITSGIYFVKIRTNKTEVIKKLIKI
jgi:hypothetical protein